MSCNDNYVWTGSTWDEGTADEYTIFLSEGRTLKEMIQSRNTKVPAGIELYCGSDFEVPGSLRCSDRDLVISCSELATLHSAAVYYYDPLACAWVGPKSPELFIIDKTKTWGVWRKFLDIVIPFKSEINLRLSGCLSSESSSSTPSDDSKGVSTIQLVQPPETFPLSLVVEIFDDPKMTAKNVIIDTKTPNPAFPILTSSSNGFVEYPAAGSPPSAAGSFVAIDLTNLSYNDRVYIRWSWLNAETGQQAGGGSAIYPAFALTNPDNIGFVWEQL